MLRYCYWMEMSTAVWVYGMVQLTFFLVVRLNINIVTSCDLLIVIHCALIISSLHLENKLKKNLWNVAKIWICQIGCDFIFKLVDLFIEILQTERVTNMIYYEEVKVWNKTLHKLEY